MSPTVQQPVSLPQSRRSERPPSEILARLGLAQRSVLFVLVFAAEWIPISTLRYQQHGHAAFQFPMVFASLFVALGYVKAKSTFQGIARELEGTPFGLGFLAGHVGALLAFLGLSLVSFGDTTARVVAHLTAFYCAGFLSIGCAAFTLVPPKLLWRLLRHTRSVSGYALPVAVVVWYLMQIPPWVGDRIWNGNAWMPATDLTFALVKTLLRLFLPQVIADRATMTIGSPKFAVTIMGGCSGWEGTLLMLVFSVSWICLLRREFRFPRALLLVPAALAVAWVCNALRITALILLGVAGAPQVAMGGFHSQAGWIAFNAVALGFAVASRKISWFAGGTPEPRLKHTFAANPTAAYLMPFLAILAAGMISRAASGGFESFYPLRFLAAGATLWIFRRTYAEFDWRFGWFSLAGGSAVFALWLALDRFSGAHADHGILTGLALWPATARVAWLAVRAAGAIVTVPVAEELAFRGFLIRRLMTDDFTSLSPRTATYFSVLISSVAFGLLHGNRWPAGTLAGLLYSAAFLRRGRIGDAVAAHALTNALLAAWVLWTGDSSLW